MPIKISKFENDISLLISGDINAPLNADTLPLDKFKGAARVTVEIDANITDATAALQLANTFGRIGVALATIKSARGLAILPAIAADAIVVADGSTIEFSCLPSKLDTKPRYAIIAKLAARLGESEETIAGYFDQRRVMKDSEAAALFARPLGFGSKALLNRDGSLSPEKIFARFNSARSKAKAVG